MKIKGTAICEVKGFGRKVKIIYICIKDALLDNPDLPVTFAGAAKEYPAADIEKWRIEARRA